LAHAAREETGRDPDEVDELLPDELSPSLLSSVSPDSSDESLELVESALAAEPAAGPPQPSKAVTARNTRGAMRVRRDRVIDRSKCNPSRARVVSARQVAFNA
jgi:hypothetical protein